MSETTIHEPVNLPPRAVVTTAPGGERRSAGELPAPAAAATAVTPAASADAESRGARFVRMAHRARLHLYAVATVALVVYVVALATSNTHRAKVDWVFSSSSVPLVWLMLFAAILGWLLGIVVTILFRLRTRAPHAPLVEIPSSAPAAHGPQP